jgi:hypothetical protein
MVMNKKYGKICSIYVYEYGIIYVLVGFFTIFINSFVVVNSH